MGKAEQEVMALMWEYSERSGLALTTVSGKCSGSGATYERMRNGKHVTGARLTKMVDWLRWNWKDGWPEPQWPNGFDLCESDLERQMLDQIRDAGLPDPLQQYEWCAAARYRADFAWPLLCDVDSEDRAVLREGVLLEVKGQVWGVKRSAREAVKRNRAIVDGWTILEVWPEHIKSGYALGMLTEVLL